MKKKQKQFIMVGIVALALLLATGSGVLFSSEIPDEGTPGGDTGDDGELPTTTTTTEVEPEPDDVLPTLNNPETEYITIGDSVTVMWEYRFVFSSNWYITLDGVEVASGTGAADSKVTPTYTYTPEEIGFDNLVITVWVSDGSVSDLVQVITLAETTSTTTGISDTPPTDWPQGFDMTIVFPMLLAGGLGVFTIIIIRRRTK